MPATTFNAKAIQDESSYQKAIKQLYEEISKVKKEITYYDVFNIVDTVVNPKLFEVQVNNLTNNSSLVINTLPFYSNGKLYGTGDVILKNANGEWIHIRAQAGGIYYPSQLSGSNGQYELVYKFSSAMPEIESSKNGSLAKEIKFELQGADASKSSIYGKFEEFDKEYTLYGTSTITPMVKFFLMNENEIEEISLEYTRTYNNNTWTIAADAPDNTYIQVK